MGWKTRPPLLGFLAGYHCPPRRLRVSKNAGLDRLVFPWLAHWSEIDLSVVALAKMDGLGVGEAPGLDSFVFSGSWHAATCFVSV